MKKHLIIMLGIITLFPLFSNDAWNEIYGGAARLHEEEESSVQMESETIIITLYDDYYEVDVTFYFYNGDKSKTLNVGFPERSYGVDELVPFIDFKTYINGNIVNDLDHLIDEEDSIFSNHNWYVKEVDFSSNDYTTTRVKYKAIYGQEFRTEYIFSTGRSWKGDIEEIRLNINNQSNRWITYFDIFGYEIESYPFLGNKGYFVDDDEMKTYPFYYKYINDRNFELIIKDINPNYNAKFSLFSSIEPHWESSLENSPYISPIGFNRWVEKYDTLLEDDYLFLTNEQLRLIRNYFFAYKGYKFSSSDLNEYFKGWEWFEPKYQISEVELSENESKIVNDITAIERFRKQYE